MDRTDFEVPRITFPDAKYRRAVHVIYSGNYGHLTASEARALILSDEPLEGFEDLPHESDAVRERDLLAAALKPLMGTLNHYIGPNARTAVGRDTVRAFGPM
jgi:hypothetical protein